MLSRLGFAATGHILLPRPPAMGSTASTEQAALRTAGRHPRTEIMTSAYDIRVKNELVERESEFVDRLFSEVQKVIVGQRDMVERVFMGLICGGHVLLEGAPGLAKTLTVNTLARCMQLDFKRVQFTPDLLPSDVLGTVIYNHQKGEFTNKQGPIFTNLLLADEINRAPAKVQSALLEAMAERNVTIGDTTYPLGRPFLVLATQNPIEQEGTYNLPEAQLDRFMFKIRVSYPNPEEELSIIDRVAVPGEVRIPKVEPIITAEDIANVGRVLEQIIVERPVREYIVSVVGATREPAGAQLPALTPFIDFGASPRASIALFQAARAHAFLRRRGYVSPEDVKAVAPDVLRHRVILSYEAEAEGKTVEEIVRVILEHVHVP
ncbi:MoxR-like ATPase in aerotolerance operon [Enhygromyxa salina]|uniref:MoxR-like ATPase in aerotolerance operon n=2 Tax=Enhygromyxa salina TaxID=215803 RepID=A0A0C2CK47_9BACT|nr:MoxR-like ATPase in aerotolerance operon [Enhygromyxa salina]